METAIYVRVSTQRQQQAQTIEQQLARLRAHIAEHPDWHLAEDHIYCDNGYSGAKLNRPGLDRLRDHAALARFEQVIITAPDRLARKYVHQTLLVEELRERGCQVVFVDRPMSDDPHDQLVLQVRGAVAEYERQLIVDRMRRGRLTKLRNGQLLPWTRAPFGYLLDPEHPRDPHRLRIDPVKSVIVQQIFAWYTDPQHPLTLYGVARRLNDDKVPTSRGGAYWAISTLCRLMRNPVYIGIAWSERTHAAPSQKRASRLHPVGSGQTSRRAPREDWIAIHVPAIVSQEMFEAAQVRLAQNKHWARRNNTTYNYLLRGLVSCGLCLQSCMARTVHGKYDYYACRGRRDEVRVGSMERCKARAIRATLLDTLVWEDLCAVLRAPRLLTHALERARGGAWLPQVLQERRRAVEGVLTQLERQQTRLLDVYVAGVIEREEFERKREEVGKSQEGLRKQLRQLELQAQQHVDTAKLAEGIEGFCARVERSLDSLDFGQRRKLVELLIDCVIVGDGTVEIRYVVPTSSKGEEVPFCHLHSNYLHQGWGRLAVPVSGH